MPAMLPLLVDEGAAGSVWVLAWCWISDSWCCPPGDCVPPNGETLVGHIHCRTGALNKSWHNLKLPESAFNEERHPCAIVTVQDVRRHVVGAVTSCSSRKMLRILSGMSRVLQCVIWYETVHNAQSADVCFVGMCSKKVECREVCCNTLIERSTVLTSMHSLLKLASRCARAFSFPRRGTWCRFTPWLDGRRSVGLLP